MMASVSALAVRNAGLVFVKGGYQASNGESCWAKLNDAINECRSVVSIMHKHKQY